MGPANIKLGGKTYQTAPIQITVASEKEAPAATTPSDKDEKTVKPQLEGKDIFMETVVDKRKDIEVHLRSLAERLRHCKNFLPTRPLLPVKEGYWEKVKPWERFPSITGSERGPAERAETWTQSGSPEQASAPKRCSSCGYPSFMDPCNFCRLTA